MFALLKKRLNIFGANTKLPIYAQNFGWLDTTLALASDSAKTIINKNVLTTLPTSLGQEKTAAEWQELRNNTKARLSRTCVVS
jgi:hypothetical protein